MLFPDINTLFTIDLDSYFRAHGGTQHTAGAFLSFGSRNGMVAAGVEFFCGNNAAFRAGINAKVAFLAEFFIYLNVTFQNQSSKQF
jgi:hypothetical protein